MGAPADAGAAQARSAVDWRAVGAFVAIAYGLTWAVEFGAFGVVPGLRGGFAAAVVLGLVMWLPALASWIVCRFVTREPWTSRVGLRPGVGWRRIVALGAGAVGLVVAATLLAVAIAAAADVSGVDLGLSGLTERLAGTPGAPPAGVVLAITVVQALVAPFTINGLLALGEELGWRGWLLPALLPLGRGAAIALTGLVWGLWHAPLIVLIGYEYGPGANPAVGVPLFTLFCVAAGALLAWVRLRGAGVLPCAIGHGAINAWAGLPLLLAPAGEITDPLLGASNGVCAVLAYALVAAAAWWLAARRRRGDPAVGVRAAR